MNLRVAGEFVLDNKSALKPPRCRFMTLIMLLRYSRPSVNPTHSGVSDQSRVPTKPSV